MQVARMPSAVVLGGTRPDRGGCPPEFRRRLALQSWSHWSDGPALPRVPAGFYLLLSGASAVASPECLSSRYSSGDASAQLGSPLPQRLTRGRQRSARLAPLSQRLTLSRGSRDAWHYGTRRSQPSRAHARRVLGSQVLGSQAPFCGSRAPFAKMTALSFPQD